MRLSALIRPLCVALSLCVALVICAPTAVPTAAADPNFNLVWTHDNYSWSGTVETTTYVSCTAFDPPDCEPSTIVSTTSVSGSCSVPRGASSCAPSGPGISVSMSSSGYTQMNVHSHCPGGTPDDNHNGCTVDPVNPDPVDPVNPDPVDPDPVDPNPIPDPPNPPPTNPNCHPILGCNFNPCANGGCGIPIYIPVAPSVPTGLSISCTASPGDDSPTVAVSWDSVSNADEYEVTGALYYSDTDTSFTTNAVFFDVSYDVQVSASNSGGSSALSSPVSDICPPRPAPPVPSGLDVDCAVGNLRVTVSWGVTHGAEEYEVEGGLSYSGAATSFYATGSGGTKYRVRVRAFDDGGGGWSGWSRYRSDTCPPPAPTDVVVVCVSGEIVATWTDPSSDPDNLFTALVSITEPGGSPDISVEVVSITEFRKTGTWPLGTIVAFGVAAEKDYEASSRTSAPDTTCTIAPTGLDVECTASGATPLVEVSWDAPVGMTVGSYEVEGDLAYTGVSTWFSRTGAYLAKYEVRVRAYDSVKSEWTGWTGYESGTCPIADPADVVVVCVSGEITATWTDPAPNPDTQYLATATVTEPGSSADTVAELVTPTEFSTTGTWLNGTTVEFHVQAVNNGEYSSQVSAPDTECFNYL